MENKKEWIEFLVTKSKFKLTEEEKNKFENDLDIFEEQLKDLDKINLEGVRPIATPFVKFESDLRDDDNVVNKSEMILENASNTKDGYIILKKENK